MTGYHADDIGDLVGLTKRAIELNRRSVRDQARTRFDHHRMARAYASFYDFAREGTR